MSHLQLAILVDMFVFILYLYSVEKTSRDFLFFICFLFSGSQFYPDMEGENNCNFSKQVLIHVFSMQ